MAGDRPIDRFRDGAFQMDVGDADDQSGVRGLVEVGGRLLVVKEKGIYVVIQPDDVDPQRTNPALPRAQRRELNYGSDDPYVGRVLLTAVELFKKDRVVSECKPEAAVELAFELLKDLIAMREMYQDLDRVQLLAESKMSNDSSGTGNIVLPSIPDIQARVELFLLKARHAVGVLNDIAVLFFGDKIKKKKWLEALLEVVAKREGDKNPFATFLSNNGWVLLRVMAMRNAIEHPKPTHKVVVRNFEHGQGHGISSPTVEVLHPELPHPPVPAVMLMSEIAERLSVIAEVFFANFSQMHPAPGPGLTVFVHEVPVAQRRYPTVRYRYVAQMGDQIVPFG